MTCFAWNSVLSDTVTVEIGQRNVFIDVSLTQHCILQMKTTDDMRKVDALLANCNRNLVT